MGAVNRAAWSLSCILVILTVIIQGKSHHGTENVVSGSENSIRLPQLLPMSIKFGSAKFWNEVSTDACGAAEIHVIHSCGAEELYNDIMVSRGKSSNHADFKTRLTSICRRADEYFQCIESRGITTCKSEEKTIIDVFVKYICGEGREHLLSSDGLGTCLSILHHGEVAHFMENKEECQTAFVDLSNIIQSAMSIYHDQGGVQTGEGPAIEQTLRNLCAQWYILERCVFPVYGQLCGNSSVAFYSGLLANVKQSLVEEFETFSEDVKTLATCDLPTGKLMRNLTRTRKLPTGFDLYILQQYTGWNKAAHRSRVTSGTCNRWTTMMESLACLWGSLTSVGPTIINMSQNPLIYGKQICESVIKPFLTCFNNRTGTCPPGTRLEMDDVIHWMCEAVKHSGELLECVDAMSAAHISEDQCGMTLTDLFNAYIFQGYQIYSQGEGICTGKSPFQQHLDIDCMIHSISLSSINASHVYLKPRCVKEVLPTVSHLLQSLNKLMGGAKIYYQQMFHEICPKSQT